MYTLYQNEDNPFTATNIVLAKKKLSNTNPFRFLLPPYFCLPRIRRKRWGVIIVTMKTAVAVTVLLEICVRI